MNIGTKLPEVKGCKNQNRCVHSVSSAVEGSMSGYHYDYYQDSFFGHQSGGDSEDKGDSEVKFSVKHQN